MKSSKLTRSHWFGSQGGLSRGGKRARGRRLDPQLLGAQRDAQLEDAEKAELEEKRRLRKRIKELEEEIEIRSVLRRTG